jgi:hypothetical protein
MKSVTIEKVGGAYKPFAQNKETGIGSGMI